MRMTMVVVMAVVSVVAMVIVIAMVLMAVTSVVVMVIVIAMVLMTVTSVVVMVIVIVMVPMTVTRVVVMVVVTMSVNHPIEVFSLSIHERRSYGTFNGENTVVGQSPFEDITKLTINGVVLRIAIEVGFHTSMTLNGDHRSHPEFTLGHLFATTMSAMGMNTTDCSVTGQQQGKNRGGIQERKTREEHRIRNSEQCADESAN